MKRIGKRISLLNSATAILTSVAGYFYVGCTMNKQMNIFRYIFSYVPALMSYLRGNRLFQEQNYKEAIHEFEKCLNHPKFQNELLFSSYGQALCTAGRLNDGSTYLLMACQIYDESGWKFDNEFALNLAKETLSVLEHVTKFSAIEEGKQYFGRELQLIKN